MKRKNKKVKRKKKNKLTSTARLGELGGKQGRAAPGAARENLVGTPQQAASVRSFGPDDFRRSMGHGSPST